MQLKVYLINYEKYFDYRMWFIRIFFVEENTKKKISKKNLYL